MAGHDKFSLELRIKKFGRQAFLFSVNLCCNNYMRFQHPMGHTRNANTDTGMNVSGVSKDILVWYLAGDCLTLLKPSTICCLAMRKYRLHIDAHVSFG